MQCEAHFRPAYDGSVNSFRLNVGDLLREHYLHSFDLERDILVPLRAANASERRPADGSIDAMLGDLRPTRE